MWGVVVRLSAGEAWPADGRGFQCFPLGALPSCQDIILSRNGRIKKKLTGALGLAASNVPASREVFSGTRLPIWA